MTEEDRTVTSDFVEQNKWRLAMIMFVLLAIVSVGYAWHERSVASDLGSQNAQIAAALKQTQAQMDSLAAKINALAEAQAQPAAAARPSATPATKRAAAHHMRKDDPRWKKVQAQLDDQNKAIEAPRQDLAGTRTELSGSIARTHGELVVLQRKGERTYYEFDINKSKDYWHKGPIAVRLKKANTKHQYADVELIVDDANLQQKHVNLYQPVIFYAGDGQRPVELVINKVDKNHVHGYVSEPKYKQAELTAMSAGSDSSNTNTQAVDQTTSAPQPRRKLEVSR